MMLIAVGEQLKQLDAVPAIDLNRRFPRVDWKGAKASAIFSVTTTLCWMLS